ncbi:MAG: hypothetical protein ACMUIS_01630 [bacterium]
MSTTRDHIPGLLLSGLLCLLLPGLLLFLGGCANRVIEPCVRDGRVYCVTDEWIFSERWYSCYLRGISCTRGGCWENAREEFLRAVRSRDRDARWVRTYGMHRLPEYFPNRELGIAYYHLGDLEGAINHLTISLDQCESSKAALYLNKARREGLMRTREDTESPHLSLDPSPGTIAATTMAVSGLATDDTFVANVMVRVNDEKPLSLTELSQPRAMRFQREITLSAGLNEVRVTAIDLLGKRAEQHITVLVDREGPMIYVALPDNEHTGSQAALQGVVYDPSDVTRLSLNGEQVALTRIGENGENRPGETYTAYSFSHPLALQDRVRGLVTYEAEDAVGNRSGGSISIGQERQEASGIRQVPPPCEPVRIAMGPQGLIPDTAAPLISRQTPMPPCGATKHEHMTLFSEQTLMPFQGATNNENLFSRQTLMDLRTATKNENLFSEQKLTIQDLTPNNPIAITIGQVPAETFAGEVCPLIEIISRVHIKEIMVNDSPLLSVYGLHWSSFVTRIIRRYVHPDKEAQFCFQRMIPLVEGENSIAVTVVDASGREWKQVIRVNKKTRQIHRMEERWRMAIPLIASESSGKQGEPRQRGLTYQLMESFIDQGRFKVIELERLPFIINERDLAYHLGSPFLGLSSESGIWIDILLLGYVQEAEDSLTISASLVDLETGEILATKDVCEEVDASQLVWEEGGREHTLHLCAIMAAKFKEHFPLCEGGVISLDGEELTTGICEGDGLKQGMKLLVYAGESENGEELALIGDAKVREVREDCSLAWLTEALKHEGREMNPTDLGVITR